MSKSKKPSQKTKKRKAAKRVRAIAPSNKEATAYRALLIDPCNAALITTPYEGSQGSQVNRRVWLNSNSAVNGVFFFHPAYGIYKYENASLSTAGNLTWVDGAGDQYSRAIAGCLSVTYIGAESSRAGGLWCGNVNGGVVWNYLAAANGGGNSTVAIADVVGRLANFERTPVDRCEVNFVPNEGDERNTPVFYPATAQNNTLQISMSRVNFVAVAFISLPAAPSVQIKAVGVTEKSLASVPTEGAGVWTIGGAVRPNYNYRDELDKLARADASWYINAFRKVGMLMTGTAAGYMTAGLPGALGFLTQEYAGYKLNRQRVLAQP